jgi:hypothetical protein
LPSCSKCGKELSEGDIYCPSCGKAVTLPPPSITPSTPQPTITLPQKNVRIAVVLALVLGILGVMGIGHIYLGKIKRGMGFLIVGLILDGLTSSGFLDFVGVWFHGYSGVASFFGSYSFWIDIIVILLIFLIWQTYDAYSLAKDYNESVRVYGKKPW